MALLLFALQACAVPASALVAGGPEGGPVPSAAGQMLPELVAIAGGRFVKGSDRREREMAYQLDERAYGHARTREQGWYDSEPQRQLVATAGFHIGATPVSNRQYEYFVRDTGYPPPFVDPVTWRGYQLVHPYSSAQRFNWVGQRPPAGRQNHPVVLVSYADALAYVAWLSDKTGSHYRLPRLDEWERAARGDDGRYFPWGDQFEPQRLNSHDAGPFDTQAVGRYPGGASPHGMLDAAGQVFEWIATDPGHVSAWVKGGSWDDSGCGVCRPAARHARVKSLKHILIGFRVLRED